MQHLLKAAQPRQLTASNQAAGLVSDLLQQEGSQVLDFRETSEQAAGNGGTEPEWGWPDHGEHFEIRHRQLAQEAQKLLDDSLTRRHGHKLAAV